MVDIPASTPASGESEGSEHPVWRQDAADRITIQAPPAATAPFGVHLGAGSEPLTLGAPAFAIGAMTLGVLFTGVFPPGVVGEAIPVAILVAGMALFVTTIWGIFLGQTLLSGIFGIVAGLFLSFGTLILGLDHHWWAIPAAEVPDAKAVYFIVFCCYFIFLIPPTLKLPAIYPFLVSLVVVGFALAASGALLGDVRLNQAAGADFLLITLGLFVIWLNVNMTSMEMKHPPPLGPPVA
jgi:succinate-acetate transporter protein